MGQKELIGPGGLGGIVTIIGSNTVNINDTKTYYASSSGINIYSGNWSVYGATILSQNATSATIKWTSSGTKIIEYIATNTSSGLLEGFKSITVNSVSAPSTPTTPTISS